MLFGFRRIISEALMKAARLVAPKTAAPPAVERVLRDWTLLGLAAFDNAPNVIGAIAKQGEASVEARNDLGETPLHLAALNNSRESVAKLISLGADADARDNFGNTPLHAAVANNSPDAAGALIANPGADINAQNQGGDTPLGAALLHGHLEIAKFLLNRGADPNIKNNRGKTNLDLSEGTGKAGHAELYRAIREKGGKRGDGY